ncbi:hypothetical protein M5X00_19810 [Paenibacillus alvei]|uniref:hypothetical protein n=1 Tax=Paenibacillus alvei TaxID=44250 RepID=UPI00028A418B|nr:hypothetical protein [Paenibacillus alvei]EJW14175.1 hypothetical protein PAV_16c00120 [Paenibacillus alvei DSM 29]MCY9540016.1 hypothetical protein [Paenibacillus alvei]MCY9705510.1 hypothetical protein [Paenibacillus alvei]MCY9735749.1 hypothetical protein [Paenibacillus alvei]MCY9756490.1 hypothetical protein [Paenibacillus alvei]
MELKTYLPSAKQIDEMSLDVFQDWIWLARSELPKREEQRDPLTHLRKRISEIVADESLTEVQKEANVLCEIKRYERIIFQSQ